MKTSCISQNLWQIRAELQFIIILSYSKWNEPDVIDLEKAHCELQKKYFEYRNARLKNKLVHSINLKQNATERIQPPS